VFHAGTDRDGGQWRTRGGRVLGVTAWGRDLDSALARGYRAVEMLHWPGAVHRRDIGLKGLRHGTGERTAAERTAAERGAASVGVIAPHPGDPAEAAQVTGELARLGLRAKTVSAGLDAASLRDALRDCEEAGVEVFIALRGGDAGFARLAARLTERPVVAAPAGAREAALLAARLLAIKYPDVHAAVRRWMLEQELSGSAAALSPLTPLA
jgi:phosphoribosylcarboxyaminoimidazole (NCAIR) mutase